MSIVNIRLKPKILQWAKISFYYYINRSNKIEIEKQTAKANYVRRLREFKNNCSDLNTKNNNKRGNFNF